VTTEVEWAAIRSSVHRPWSMGLVATSDLMTFVGTRHPGDGAGSGGCVMGCVTSRVSVAAKRSVLACDFVISGNRRWPMHPEPMGAFLQVAHRRARRAHPPGASVLHMTSGPETESTIESLYRSV
jgi:hypothetical protein